MSPTIYALAIASGLGLLAVALNHLHARVALVELSLNEGLPPGFEALHYRHVAESRLRPADVGDILDAGVHVFLSRSCLACQRLVSELGAINLAVSASLHLHYVDRPRPEARLAAERNQAELHSSQLDLSQRVGADPLPFTVAVGPHGLVGRAVTPTADQLLLTARNAGIEARLEQAGMDQR